MGNVCAASSSPPPPLIDPKCITEKTEYTKSETIENPGPLEELHRKCKGSY